TDDNGLRDERTLLEQALHLERGDVFAVREFEKVLETVCDVKVTVRVFITNIARMIKTLVIEGESGGLGIVVIALHHVFAADEDLAVFFGDLHFDALEWGADRPYFVVLRAVGTCDACLGHAVALEDLNAGGPEGVRQL